MVIGFTGLSLGPVAVVEILSTTACDAASFTSPKIVCLFVSHAVGTTVIKNCEPFVHGPELAIANRYGR